MYITNDQLQNFACWLQAEQKSIGTIQKYLRDIRALAIWLAGRQLTEETAALWRQQLQANGYAPVTVNSMLAAVNGFCRYAGLDLRLKFIRVQRRIFREQSRELTRPEFQHLVRIAKEIGNRRLALVMETICASGIRVSELPFITVKAARQGCAQVSLKGKTRTVFLPQQLCSKLLQYAQKQKIAAGEIFLTGSGKSLSRGQIWAEMKRLCKMAGIQASKVFPHNLRHLFATVFYRPYKDIVRLADLLGHSSIDTTRIYLVSPGSEHQKQIENLHLVV